MGTLFGVSLFLILRINEELEKSVGQHKMKINAWSGDLDIFREISVATIAYNKILPDISWVKLETRWHLLSSFLFVTDLCDTCPVIRPGGVSPETFTYHRFDSEAVTRLHHTNSLEQKGDLRAKYQPNTTEKKPICTQNPNLDCQKSKNYQIFPCFWMVNQILA